MAQRLFQACDRCTDLVALIQRIQDDSGPEQAVPEDLVQAAKAIFPIGAHQHQVADEPARADMPSL